MRQEGKGSEEVSVRKCISLDVKYGLKFTALPRRRPGPMCDPVSSSINGDDVGLGRPLHSAHYIACSR